MLKPVWPLGLLTSIAGGQAKNSILRPPITAPNPTRTPIHQIAAPRDRVASSQTSTTAVSGSRTAESPKSVRNRIIGGRGSLCRGFPEGQDEAHEIGHHHQH